MGLRGQKHSKPTMKLKLFSAVVTVVCIASHAIAGDADPKTAPVAALDKSKVSYAYGMNLGFQRQQANADLGMDAFLRGLKDVLEDKPLEVTEAEIAAILDNAQLNGSAKRTEQEKEKLGYGMGTRAGAQLKRSGADVDVNEIAQGLKDVVEGKPTRIQKTEIPALFEQAKTYGLAQQGKKNKSEGTIFLAKNAKEPGIKVLPSGLQYRVIEEGVGLVPGTNDQIYVKYRGTFVNGRQFDRHSHFLIRCGGGIPGWEEALPRMKVGAKWQIFVPSDLAYGEEGEAIHGIGPHATLIYELQTVSIAPPDAEFGRGRLGHALEDNDIDPPPAK
jgi:FKBP-type peptidyl-prolyl cis-trans isomerase